MAQLADRHRSAVIKALHHPAAQRLQQFNLFRRFLILFSTQGYAQTSIRDIALKVKIKVPSIYAHFSSKEELFESVADYVMSDYINFVRQKATDIIGHSKVDKLYTFTEQIIEYLYENYNCCHLSSLHFKLFITIL
ncbi:TetR/AcrR family transcriptional regulator [Paenibacillus sp. BAC0078]